MAWGSERAPAADFARELSAYRAEHGTPTIEAINAATELLVRPRGEGKSAADRLGESLSTGRISGAMAGTNDSPPTAAVVFSFVRALLYLENPSAEPITPEHPDVVELQALRAKAFARRELGTFRERHLRTALRSPEAAAQHGCFALYALNGATLHIGSTSAESPLSDRIKTALEATNPVVDREHVAELELWPIPEPDPDSATTVARLEEALILRALYASAPSTLRLPARDPAGEPPIPTSRVFPLVDSGTLLAVREALHHQASELASRAKDAYDRTAATFRRDDSTPKAPTQE